MRKKIIMILIALLPSVLSFSQSRNSIRVGAGVSINPNSDMEKEYSLKVGPALSIAYTREFNKVFSLETELYSTFARTSDTASDSKFECMVKGLITPFPKKFRFLELGLGVAGRYDRTIVIYGDRIKEDKDWINCTLAKDANRFLFGINYCIRLYAIRNDKFDLFGFYEPRTNFSEGFKNYYWNSSTAGIAFGVKF